MGKLLGFWLHLTALIIWVVGFVSHIDEIMAEFWLCVIYCAFVAFEIIMVIKYAVEYAVEAYVDMLRKKVERRFD